MCDYSVYATDGPMKATHVASLMTKSIKLFMGMVDSLQRGETDQV